uniref:Uncharacterized protein n=1 Tax=Anopheles atroparvus TaxID=41427 RepID=A0A182JJA4_ANOAO
MHANCFRKDGHGFGDDSAQALTKTLLTYFGIQMGEVKDYDCDLDRVVWLLSPLANVPGGANSLNIFHNPYPPLGCIKLAFYCRKDETILGDLHYETHSIQMGEVKDYDCDLDRVVWLLSPLANVPGGANSLNIFHNPYPPLGCINLAFYCRKDETILGDLHYETHSVSSLVCPGFSILLAKGALSLQLRTNPAAEECKTVDRWLSLDLFVYRQNDFIFMYGCHQVSESLPVSIGAWILVDANATVAKRDRVLQIALLKLFGDLITETRTTRGDLKDVTP